MLYSLLALKGQPPWLNILVLVFYKNKERGALEAQLAHINFKSNKYENYSNILGRYSKNVSNTFNLQKVTIATRGES